MTKILYEKQGAGLIGILPRQLAFDTREIETDYGEETMLQVKQTNTLLTFTIVQYNDDQTERMRGSTWSFNANESTFVQAKLVVPDVWALVDGSGIEMRLVVASSGDITMAIYDPSCAEENPFNVPPFTQATSGGRSLDTLLALVRLMHCLRESGMIEGAEPVPVDCYALLATIYDAIGEHRHFQSW